MEAGGTPADGARNGGMAGVWAIEGQAGGIRERFWCDAAEPVLRASNCLVGR